MISRFDTLQQIKDFIDAVQKDLMLFERKCALLRKAHLALCSYCWYDGMEIDDITWAKNAVLEIEFPVLELKPAPRGVL